MKISLYKDDCREQWNRYVMQSDDSSCYHLIGWKDVIEKTFGHKTFYLLAQDDDSNIVGLLPLVQLKSKLFGNYMVSMPFFNYGGVCADSDHIRDNLIRDAERLALKHGAEHIELRHAARFNTSLPVKTTKVSMMLDLPPSADDLWHGFSSKLKSQIRRPVKEGMYANFGRDDELDSFYSVFSTNMRDLGTPVYSKKFFRNILDTFPEESQICTIYSKDAAPVASGFLMGFKKHLEIPWASSIRSYNKLSPNMLLYWDSLKFACEKGYRAFDFGRSTKGEGTYRFKKQWGSKPVQLYWYYGMKNEGSLPELNPDNPKYKLAIRLWKKMPVNLTRIIGPSIVKNLP